MKNADISANCESQTSLKETFESLFLAATTLDELQRAFTAARIYSVEIMRLRELFSGERPASYAEAVKNIFGIELSNEDIQLFEVTERWEHKGLMARISEVRDCIQYTSTLPQFDLAHSHKEQYMARGREIVVAMLDVCGYRPGDERTLLTELLVSFQQFSPDTFLHSVRIALYAREALKEHSFLSKYCDVQSIMRAALLHDTGKMLTPEIFFNRKLSSIEWDNMKNHAEFSVKLLSLFSSDTVIFDTILKHHHYWGSADGYPQQVVPLAETESMKTRIEASLLAFLDRFDAIVSHRSYKRRLDNVMDALAILAPDATQQVVSPEIYEFFTANPGVLTILKIPLRKEDGNG